MSELERGLRELGRELEYPPTPDLATAVARRLRAGRPRRPLRRRRLAIALAVLLLVPAGAVAAVPPVRDAVLEALGIKGVQIVRTPEPVRGPEAAPGADKPGLGTALPLAEAARRVDFAVVAPAAGELGAPAEVYVRSSPPGGALSFVYRPGGLQLTQFRGSDATAFVRKVLGPGTAVEEVDVGGERGVWITGRPHEFLYVDASGGTRTERLRLAGDTLLWERGPLTLRLEGAPSKAAALRIARSVG